MFSDEGTALAICGMAVVTYLTRASGFFLVNRMRVTGRLEAFIRAIPGAVFVSILAPTALASGPAESAASLVTVIAAWKTRCLPVAMAVGVGTVWLLRRLISG